MRQTENAAVNRQRRRPARRTGSGFGRSATSIALVTVLVLIVMSEAALAQSFGEAPEQRLRVTWDVGASHGPRIEGYVHNDALWAVTRVRLRIEGLDAGGRPVGETFAWVFGDIGPGDRGYFAVGVIRGASTYRITVASFDAVSRGGP